MDFINEVSAMIANEGFFSKFHRQHGVVQDAPTRTNINDRTENIPEDIRNEYVPKIKDLALKMCDDYRNTAVKKNPALKEHVEFFGEDGMTINETGANVIIIHWQSLEDDVKDGIIKGTIGPDGNLSDAEYEKITQRDRMVSKWSSAAKKIHPKCTIKSHLGDVDMIYIDLDLMHLE